LTAGAGEELRKASKPANTSGMEALFCIERTGPGVPIALLHGFGGSHDVWQPVLDLIGGARHTLAYDLPGHAASLVRPGGSAATMAKAIIADLDSRGSSRAHLVGHSLGGATAALIALMRPGLAASLTLLAPGGFGSEINQRLLRRYAAASEEEDLLLLLEQFFGWEHPVPAALAAAQSQERQAPGANDALRAIVETFFEGDRQKLIPVADVAGIDAPVKVIWGTQDRVLPTRQAHRLPGRMAVHIFEAAGHMLPLEIPADVAALVLENTR
jgi:pyruvate dehydrogenase E2 component (dihydrolipoamide acetyltransferase)